MNKRLVLATTALALAALSACAKSEATKAASEKPATAVEAAVAEASELVEGIEVTGSLEPKYFADVRTQIPGLVKQVFVTEWVRVKKGQPLARIDVAEVEAIARRAEASVEASRAALAQAQVAATRAERELARLLKLKEAGLATQQSVDDATTEAAAAAARTDAARAQIRVAEQELKQSRARQAKGLVLSPLDGIVAMRSINVGDLASDAGTAQPVMRIVDNRLLNLTVSVPSADSARVKVGQPLQFTVDSLPGRTFAGRVMYINPEISSAERSLKVIAEVTNRDELLKAGLFAKGRIVIGNRSGIVQLPRTALSGWDTAQRKAVVFVLEKGRARARSVTTGIGNGESVEISSGLRPGERYVTRGNFNLRDGDTVQVAAASGTGKP